MWPKWVFLDTPSQMNLCKIVVIQLKQEIVQAISSRYQSDLPSKKSVTCRDFARKLQLKFQSLGWIICCTPVPWPNLLYHAVIFGRRAERVNRARARDHARRRCFKSAPVKAHTWVLDLNISCPQHACTGKRRSATADTQMVDPSRPV